MGSFDIANAVDLPNLARNLNDIEAKLKTVIPQYGPLKIPVKRVVGSSSKRLRSALVLAVVQPHKAVDANVISACVAIELLHLGSLVHDDIMDSSSTRWNKPTVNATEGVNTAILVGDYLFAKANYLAASISTEVATLIADTIVKLCEGQALESADVGNIKRTKASYIEAISGKTGSLVSCACIVGAMCVGLGDKETRGLGDFGKYFGVAFQILDDVSDLVSTQELLGKPVGQDIKEGIYTLPLILSMQGATKAKLTGLLKTQPVSQAQITKLLIQNGTIKLALEEVEKYNRKALNAIKATEPLALQNLPRSYADHVMQNIFRGQYA